MSDPFAIGGAVRLRPGREASLLRRHPWIYGGALAGRRPEGVAPVTVEAADGRTLGTALPGGTGSLALRVVAWAGETWNAALLRRRLSEAAALRERLRLDSDAFRLVHAEGDRLPGLVIDRYGAVAVVQPFEPAWEPYLAEITAFLTGELGCSTVLLRRAFGPERGAASLAGALPVEPVVIREGAARFPVDIVAGQKTGFFLDQRDNRRRVAELASGAGLLNLFSYSGGFAVAALLAGGRRAVNVDAAAPALALARQAYRLNALAADDGDFVAGDAFQVSRDLVASGARFEVVVCDPPAFVKRKAELSGGLRGYKDINLQALKLLAPRGLLLTCSCSALVDEEAFGGALLAAALDAGRAVRVLERRGASPDHPVSLFCPETRHLKAWLCQV